MPVIEEFDDELVSRFIRTACEDNAFLAATHGDRFWQEENIRDNPRYPYIFWSGFDYDSVSYMLPQTYVGVIHSEYTVRSVREYPSSYAAWSDFRATQQALRDALTGIAGREITDPDGNYLGSIQASTWVRNYKSPATVSGNVRTLQRGIVINVSWK